MKFFAVFFTFLSGFAFAESPQVSHRITFAGMELIIHPDARKEIQTDVDALYANIRYFQAKVDRAKIYFPIIEQIFLSEGLPSEFKYLVLQESSLVADAVSVSNAVGYWQFKDFTAKEMGLRVDHLIDERMNLISSTQSAARYLKKNNELFNNWILTLQSYQMGAGGTMRQEGDKHVGAKTMNITTHTYWYVKKFLSVMTAFQQYVNESQPTRFLSITLTQDTSLPTLAKQLNVEEKSLREFNKWIKQDKIPNDKMYYLLLPAAEYQPVSVYSELFKQDAEKNKGNLSNRYAFINSVKLMYVKPSEKLDGFLKRGKLSLDDFLLYNDLTEKPQSITATRYYVQQKKKIGEADFYTAKTGDDWWSISQQTGVQLKKIKQYNRKLHTPGEGDKIKLIPGWKFFLHKLFKKEQAPVPMEEPPVLFQPAEVKKNIVVDSVSQEDKNKLTKREELVKILTDTTSFVQPKAELPEPTSTTTFDTDTREKTLPDYHIVQQGETIFSISRKYFIVPFDLMKANQLTTSDVVSAGRKLTLPKKTDTKTEQKSDAKTVKPEIKSEPITHEVKAGETLYSIATKYKVSTQDVIRWNALGDNTIHIGQKLLIQKSLGK